MPSDKRNAMPDHDPTPSAGKDDRGEPSKLSRRDFISHLGTSSIIAGSMSLSTAFAEAAEAKTAAAASRQGLCRSPLR